MVVATSRYSTILNIPGHSDMIDTPRGRFCDELEKLTGFRPGRTLGLLSGLGPFLTSQDEGYRVAISLENSFEMGSMVSIDLLYREGFTALRKLLSEYELASDDDKMVQLCCEDATRESEQISFLNWHGEKLIYLAFPYHLYSLRLVAFIDKRTQAEDDLERKLVSEWNRSEGGNSFKLYSSKEEAKRAIDQKVLWVLRRTVDEPWDSSEPVRGAYISRMAEKYRYPPELTDEEITCGDGIVQVVTTVDTILQEYGDGAVLVGHSYDEPPFNNASFNKRKGVAAFRTLGCEHCCPKRYRTLREEGKRLALREMEGGFLGDALFFGYELDPARLKVAIRRRMIV